MKNLISTILLLIVTLPILAQERKLEQVDENLYSYTSYSNGKVAQRGYYKEINGSMFEHGIWKDNFGTIALFENGEMMWIKPKGSQKYTKEQMEIHRLKRKVAKLEQALTSL